MSRLDEVVKLLKGFEGISRKYVLPGIIHRLRTESYDGEYPHSLGEDSAAITTACDDYVLLTTDAIVEDLCLNHPKAAGFNAILANVMDIYAAGGVPTSFAIALSYSDKTIGEKLLEGLIEGSHRFKIPIVRGHTNPTSRSTYVVGSATGTVSKSHLLTAGGATPGDKLVLIYDRKGKRGEHYPLGWDSVTDRSSDETVRRLTVMTAIAAKQLVTASKDVSTAGVIGTAGMMVEYSGVGGRIDLNAVESSCPRNIPLEDWLRMYISLGFLVAVRKKNLESLTDIIEEHDMYSAVIGEVVDTNLLQLVLDSEMATLFDFSSGSLLTPRSVGG
ncbi:hypothetical protein EU546_08380 [Candidatus Thorarchaeota archaeon]|nr:MAG: hypothetical protein EU546_08380 [Candidatus Thorarchaeota archaeon]